MNSISQEHATIIGRNALSAIFTVMHSKEYPGYRKMGWEEKDGGRGGFNAILVAVHTLVFGKSF